MKRILFLILSALLIAGVAGNAAPAKKKTETVTYTVSMHCQNCVNKLNDKLSFLNGVKDLKVSLKDKSVTIKYDPSKIDETEFVKQIKQLGYTAEKAAPAGTKAAPAK